MPDLDRPNPLSKAATRTSALVAPLGGLLSAAVAYGALTAAQADAAESLFDTVSPTVTAVGVIVAGITPAVSALVAAFGTSKSARPDVTPVGDERAVDAAGRLVKLVPLITAARHQADEDGAA